MDVVSICYKYATILFDPGSTLSYVAINFASNFDFICEPFMILLHVSTFIIVFLVANQVYQSCVVTFVGRETWVDLIILDMVDFDIIVGMDWLASYHATLDCYVEIVTLATSGVPRLAWKGILNSVRGVLYSFFMLVI